MLGFLRQRGSLFRFQPATSFRPRFPLAGGGGTTTCRAVDARHGRVLVHRYSSQSQSQGASSSGIPWPATYGRCPGRGSSRRAAAGRLLSSAPPADGCDHLDCAGAGGPFRVVLVGTQWRSPSNTSVHVYSSETGRWSDEFTAVQHRNPIGSGRTAMAGNALYFWFQRRSGILRHDLGTQMSCVEQMPAFIEGNKRVLLTATEDGSLGFAMIQKFKLSLWSRGTDGGWAQNRVIQLNILLHDCAFSYPPQLVAFADGIGVTVMVQTVDGLFAIDLKSSNVREIGKSLKLHAYGVVPFVSFCTPALGAGRQV